MEREDIEYEHGAVDDAHAQSVFEIVYLRRGKFVIEHRERDIAFGIDHLLYFLRFPFAYKSLVIGGRARLYHAQNRFAAGGVEQPFELVERGLDFVFGHLRQHHRNEHRFLAFARSGL